ncbi:MAG TPA: glycosyltransferase [Bacillota bacterium]|nr:glycosyltransferase [Bacillota bacterium]
MKIALIGQNFDRECGQGVAKYSGELYESLKERREDTKKIELGSSKNPLKTLFNNIFVSLVQTLSLKSRVYHFLMPEVAFPCFVKRPSIVTVYDLIPLILKNERRKSFNLFFKIMLSFVKRADHLIVISKSTERDVIKYLGVPKENISLIYPGVDHNVFFPLKRKKNKKFTVGFLSGFSQRKNAKILLEVAEMLKEEDIVFKIGGKGGSNELKNTISYFPKDSEETREAVIKAYEREGPVFISLKKDKKIK